MARNFPPEIFTPKNQKKNFFQCSGASACCDGVTLCSELSIFDLKCMYQFLQAIFRFCV